LGGRLLQGAGMVQINRSSSSGGNLLGGAGSLGAVLVVAHSGGGQISGDLLGRDREHLLADLAVNAQGAGLGIRAFFNQILTRNEHFNYLRNT
ncbi:MAG: hypothetical protein K2N48_00085, partial [Muribaculaceae bacterium]|nr:hypothetical protein [Muribaculaceae bacterium]